MFGKWHPPGTFPGGVYELNLLGSIGLAGIVFGVVYLPCRLAAKRARKKGFSDGFAEAINDPDTFVKVLKKAREAGIIKEHVQVHAEEEEAEAASPS